MRSARRYWGWRALAALAMVEASTALALVPAPVSATFELPAARVRSAAERALTDAHYVVGKQGTVVTGTLRRKTRTVNDRADAIEELRRISRFDPAQIPDPRALREYRITQAVTITQVGETRTTVSVHAEIVTASHVPAKVERPGPRMAFASLGVVEEETLLRIREHLAEPAHR
jgi:hypothetical protein